MTNSIRNQSIQSNPIQSNLPIGTSTQIGENDQLNPNQPPVHLRKRNPSVFKKSQKAIQKNSQEYSPQDLKDYQNKKQQRLTIINHCKRQVTSEVKRKAKGHALLSGFLGTMAGIGAVALLGVATVATGGIALGVFGLVAGAGLIYTALKAKSEYSKGIETLPKPLPETLQEYDHQIDEKNAQRVNQAPEGFVTIGNEMNTQRLNVSFEQSTSPDPEPVKRKQRSTKDVVPEKKIIPERSPERQKEFDNEMDGLMNDMINDPLIQQPDFETSDTTPLGEIPKSVQEVVSGEGDLMSIDELAASDLTNRGLTAPNLGELMSTNLLDQLSTIYLAEGEEQKQNLVVLLETSGPTYFEQIVNDFIKNSEANIS